MRYTTSTIAAFTLASVVGVFAQEQAPAQRPAPQNRRPRSKRRRRRSPVVW